MALESQLGAPDLNQVVDAKYSLNQIYINEAGAAEPVAETELDGIQSVTQDAPTPGISEEVFHQAGGDESAFDQKDWRYELTISMIYGYWAVALASIQAITHSDAGEAGLINKFSPHPLFTLERFLRQKDNETHILSEVYQDLVLMPVGAPGEMGTNNLIDIKCFSKHDNFTLASGTQLEYDVFAGDGSTVVFGLSSTPLAITDVSDLGREDWELANAVYVKVKLTGENTGTRQATGISLTNSDLTFTTAPAASSEIQILFVIATP